MYRFALVGYGNAGRQHAEALKTCGELVAIADPQIEALSASHPQQSAALFRSIDELLSSELPIDVVVVASPNGYHAEHSIKSLQAGKHVVCETPFCLTTAGAWQTIETQKFCRKKFLSFHNPSWMPLFNEASNWVKEAGPVLSFELMLNGTLFGMESWKSSWFPGGGALNAQFSEAVALIVSLFGEVVSVTGTAELPDKNGAETNGAVTVVMYSGVKGMILWDTKSSLPARQELVVNATDGSMEWGGPNWEVMQANGKRQSAALPVRSIESYYQQLPAALDNLNDGRSIHAAASIVSSTEKIYRAVLPQQFSDR